MAVSVTHKFVSAVADGGDTNLVQPSNWNDTHDLVMATDRLLGRTTAGTGAAEEVSVGTGLSLSALTLTIDSTVTTLTGTQTLTNKTMTSPSISDPTITGTIIEDVYNLTGTDIDPANGSIQYITLSENTTFTSSIAAGEAVTLMIDDGTAHTVTWPTMTWVNNGGTAPTLATTGYTVVVLWKVSTTLYGALVGNGT